MNEQPWLRRTEISGSTYSEAPSAPSFRAVPDPALGEQRQQHVFFAPPRVPDGADRARGISEAEYRPLMLDVLPETYVEARPPLIYRIVREAERSPAPARISKSLEYRAHAFSCAFYHKPISRCIRLKE
jgi:hypothetical protein